MTQTPTDNLRLLTTEADQLRAYAEQMKRELGVMNDIAQEIAKTRRVYYEAYVAAGFTETQALILCQKLT